MRSVYKLRYSIKEHVKHISIRRQEDQNKCGLRYRKTKLILLGIACAPSNLIQTVFHCGAYNGKAQSTFAFAFFQTGNQYRKCISDYYCTLLWHNWNLDFAPFCGNGHCISCKIYLDKTKYLAGVFSPFSRSVLYYHTSTSISTLTSTSTSTTTFTTNSRRWRTHHVDLYTFIYIKQYKNNKNIIILFIKQ